MVEIRSSWDCFFHIHCWTANANMRVCNVISFTLLLHIYQVRGAVRLVSDRDEQIQLLTAANKTCMNRIIEASGETTLNDSSHCPIDFDKVACWPQTFPNQTASISCPDYVHLFDSGGTATRYCTSEGTWAINSRNNSVGDYRQCFVDVEEIYDLPTEKILRNAKVQVHLPYLVTIYTIGNSLSIAALLVALLLFGYFRKLLSCNRNVIHANMFISFILRSVVTLVHFFVTAKQEQQIKLSLATNNQSAADLINMSQSNWGCKLATSIWMYTRLNNFMWVFMEALYLHLLIYVLTFNNRLYAFRIIVLGWGTSFIFLIPWVMTRIFLDNRRCWISYELPQLMWIVEAPNVAIVLVNTGFFINLIKLLATKLKASEMNGNRQEVGRRLAKSTLVLIPLFAVHYVAFLFTTIYRDVTENLTLELFGLYFDTIFTSFQGLFVAILFCFLNAEVICEVQKTWSRLKIRYDIFLTARETGIQRTSLTSDTAVTFTSRRHSSSTGLLTTSLTTDSRSASLRRDVNKEFNHLNSEKSDSNKNMEIEPFLIKK